MRGHDPVLVEEAQVGEDSSAGEALAERGIDPGTRVGTARLKSEDESNPQLIGSCATSGREAKVKSSQRKVRTIRWALSVILAMAGMTTMWAWGQVGRVVGTTAEVKEPEEPILYAAWQPVGAEHAILFDSRDEGSTWQPLVLPGACVPVIWVGDGGKRVAVATDDGSLLRSDDGGDHWVVAANDLPTLSLAWGDDGSLYVGTDGRGVYRLASDGTMTNIATTQGELASARVVGLSQAEGRLIAATPTVLFYTDGADAAPGSSTWTRSTPPPDRVTTVVAAGRETVYAGTATSGVYRSVDAGQTWQPARQGLGLAAGQMVRITALRADPQEPGVLYAAVDHLVGSTHVHASAAGIFVALDGGASWQPLAGPVFPEAGHTSSLVLVPGRPLYVQAVTARGLQSYAPDVKGALAALESADPRAQAAAARELGVARPAGVWNELLAALDDREPAVSLAASEALGHINDPASVGSLLPALQHPHEFVRLGAARALGMMGIEAAVQPLRAMLLNGKGPEVSVAGEALASIGSPAAIEALLVALADSEPTARWHVAMAALEAIGEPAVGSLLETLSSEDVYARRSAAQALGWIGSPSAAAALEDALADADAGVQSQAAWALSEIGDPAAENQWPARWATILDRLQPLRWMVLALSLAAAGWLAASNRHSLATR
jgi:HEAT repeat protein/photosystem II stability/assembly factor-like uncharacterized protein